MNLDKKLEALEDEAQQRAINALYEPLSKRELLAAWCAFAWDRMPSEESRALAVKVKVEMFKRASPALRPVLWPPEERALLAQGTSVWASLPIDRTIEDPLEDLDRDPNVMRLEDMLGPPLEPRDTLEED